LIIDLRSKVFYSVKAHYKTTYRVYIGPQAHPHNKL